VTSKEENKLSLFENSVLSRLLGLEKDKVMGGWTKLHNKEFPDLYSLPSIIRMIESRKMRWVEHVARIGKEDHI
jgi:hypothetical protein